MESDSSTPTPDPRAGVLTPELKHAPEKRPPLDGQRAGLPHRGRHGGAHAALCAFFLRPRYSGRLQEAKFHGTITTTDTPRKRSRIGKHTSKSDFRTGFLGGRNKKKRANGVFSAGSNRYERLAGHPGGERADRERDQRDRGMLRGVCSVRRRRGGSFSWWTTGATRAVRTRGTAQFRRRVQQPVHDRRDRTPSAPARAFPPLVSKNDPSSLNRSQRRGEASCDDESRCGAPFRWSGARSGGAAGLCRADLGSLEPHVGDPRDGACGRRSQGSQGRFPGTNPRP